MGSKNDYDIMRAAVEILREFGVPHEARVVSAHRTPDLLFSFADTAAVPRPPRHHRRSGRRRPSSRHGRRANSSSPSSASPSPATALQGIDSLLSIVQMPKGVPVGTLAIGKPGAANAGLLAVQILATTDPALRERLRAWRNARTRGSPRPGPARIVGCPTSARLWQMWQIAFAPCRILEPLRYPWLPSSRLHPRHLRWRTAWPLAAMAARTLGYRVHVIDPDPACPARFVVDHCFEADWNDAREAAASPAAPMSSPSRSSKFLWSPWKPPPSYAPLRPSADLLQVIQNRIRQKDWLRERGFPLGPWRAARSAEDMQEAVAALGPKMFCQERAWRLRRRSQGKLGFGDPTSAEDAWRIARPAALRRRAGARPRARNLRPGRPLAARRNPKFSRRVEPPRTSDPRLERDPRPSHRSSCSARPKTRLPPSPTPSCSKACSPSEIFVTKSGRLLVNELAPRPHNSYHASERACVTSQFEQCVRAVCDLPLGYASRRPARAIANLLGDLWLDHSPHFDRALAVPGVRVHLYEKHQPRKGRKMGHLSAVGATPQEAVERVLQAQRLL